MAVEQREAAGQITNSERLDSDPTEMFSRVDAPSQRALDKKAARAGRIAPSLRTPSTVAQGKNEASNFAAFDASVPGLRTFAIAMREERDHAYGYDPKFTRTAHSRSYPGFTKPGPR